MGQYFKLVNIDQKCELRHVGGLKLWEYVVSTSAEQLVGLIRRPHWVEFKISGDLIAASKQKSSSSPLVRLPQEIIDMIVSLLADGQQGRGLICLSLTCAYFFRLLAPSVQDALVEDSGPWAGNRLIFVGDYAHGYPNGIANAKEASKWQQLGDNPLYYMPSNLAAEGKHAKKTSFFQSLDGFKVWGRLLKDARKMLDEEDSLHLFERLVKLLTQPTKVSSSSSLAPVLRNLTTKEYVRDAALAESDYAYSLGEVVLIHTQWTQDPSGLQGLPLRGKWAGHRFDISNLAHVVDEGWKDVSENAVEKLSMVAELKKKDGRRA